MGINVASSQAATDNAVSVTADSGNAVSEVRSSSHSPAFHGKADSRGPHSGSRNTAMGNAVSRCADSATVGSSRCNPGSSAKAGSSNLSKSLVVSSKLPPGQASPGSDMQTSLGCDMQASPGGDVQASLCGAMEVYPGGEPLAQKVAVGAPLLPLVMESGPVVVLGLAVLAVAAAVLALFAAALARAVFPCAPLSTLCSGF
ncbi:UNVERIFIED_CONTAM: hypothetical protein FKN15_007954 [Acipenser sinensis]